MLHFFDQTPESLQEWCRKNNLPTFAAAQLIDWVYDKHIVDTAQMTNLSKVARQKIDESFILFRGINARHQVASDGTQKILMAWPDRLQAADELRDVAITQLPLIQASTDVRETECVMIPTEQRKTACISSQVGCPVGCAFCASGLGGVEGNLTRGQIVEQVYRLGLLPDVERITNVVFMGMGEPLANFAAVTNAVRTINAPPKSGGLGIGARKITISTVGLPTAIRKLVNFDLPITLALSLHAPNDELRRQLIPWAAFTTIAELLNACDEYFQKTHREITLEYILLGGINDQPEHARELATIARRLRSNINLIRYNEVADLDFARPVDTDVRAFQKVLREKKVNVHIRASRGRDIAAACGQLRHEAKTARKST